MPLDLSALTARCAALPAGATVTVIIPRGNPVTIGGAVYQEQDTFVVPAAIFAPAALQPPPPKGDAPQPERYMVASSTLNVRQSADRDSALVGKIAAGERVAVTGEAIGGYVKLSSREGYVLASGLTGA